VRTYNGIPYVSGGFGLEERADLRAIGKTDNLELSFALQNKDYLGGADVLIKDSNGKEVLDAVSDGPLFFTKLPAGKYTIEATAEGRTEKQVAQVPAKGQTRIYFAWKNSMAESQT
jgi:phosphosulfolactate phosphohydrolase-like enzyme